jgi:hypothetical protein
MQQPGDRYAIDQFVSFDVLDSRKIARRQRSYHAMKLFWTYSGIIDISCRNQTLLNLLSLTKY